MLYCQIKELQSKLIVTNKKVRELYTLLQGSQLTLLGAGLGFPLGKINSTAPSLQLLLYPAYLSLTPNRAIGIISNLCYAERLGLDLLEPLSLISLIKLNSII